MHHRNHHEAGAWTGLVAGAAGGLAASFVMGLAHQQLIRLTGGSPRAGVQASNTEAAQTVAEHLLERPLGTEEKYLAGSALHYAVGAVVGGVFGAAASGAPALGRAAGVPFGLAVWAGLHLGATPALGLGHPYEAPLASEAAEFASHLVYGVTTEMVRRGVIAAVRAIRS